MEVVKMHGQTLKTLAACAAVAIVALSSVRAEDDYSCTLCVGNPNAAQTKSSTSGTHVTGCIIQLLVKEKVERAYVSNSGWSLYAKKYPLPEAEVLKTH